MDADAAGCRVSCHACDPGLAALVVPRLEAAVRSLGLAAHLSEVVLCVDDLPGRDDGWLHVEAKTAGERPVLTLYCSGDALRPEPADRVEDGARQDWEQRPVPRGDIASSADDFDAAAADAHLHHQCALAADLLRGGLVPELVPPGLAESFAAAWDVVIDGRLSRDGLPGPDMAARRARFSRLFSSAGVLLPEHWQIFQSLWEGGLKTQNEVLGAVRRLPSL